MGCHRRDPDKVKKWAHRNLIRFSKTKYKVLHLGWGSPWYQHGLEGEQIQRGPAKKDLGTWVSGGVDHDGKMVGLNDLKRAFPTQMILGFTDTEMGESCSWHC